MYNFFTVHHSQYIPLILISLLIHKICFQPSSLCSLCVSNSYTDSVRNFPFDIFIKLFFNMTQVEWVLARKSLVCTISTDVPKSIIVTQSGSTSAKMLQMGSARNKMTLFQQHPPMSRLLHVGVVKVDSIATSSDMSVLHCLSTQSLQSHIHVSFHMAYPSQCSLMKETIHHPG